MTIKPDNLVLNKVNVFKTIFLSFCIIIFSGWTIAAEEPSGDTAPLMSDEEEIELGKLVDEGIRRHFSVDTTHEVMQDVRKIGMKLVAVSDRQDIPYVFRILISPTLNAFSGPGGYVYITTGILGFVKTRDELAGVMGHEVAHVALRHVVKVMYEAKVSGLIDPHDPDKVEKMVSMFIFHRLKYEEDADILGATYAYKAGYNPNGLPDFMEAVLLNSMSGGMLRPFSFLLIYKLKWPGRIKALREHIATLTRESN